MAKNDSKPEVKDEKKPPEATNEKPPLQDDLSKINQKLDPVKSAEQAAKELKEPTTPMFFPRSLRLLLDNRKGVVAFKKGDNDVPQSLVDHWYIKASGAKVK